MTREEEITQASLDYANKGCGVPIMDEFTRTLCIALGQAFMAGAKWADSSSSLPKWEHICSFQSLADDSVFIEDDCLRWGDSVIPLRELKRLPKK